VPTAAIPDPTTTRGKGVKEAKELELAGWNYPRHLAGRVFAVVVHGDAVGAETLRRSLSDWLCDMKLLPAMRQGRDRSLHRLLRAVCDESRRARRRHCMQQEVRNAAKAVVEAVALNRAGRFPQPESDIDPRPK
jgi:hypothetical protein